MGQAERPSRKPILAQSSEIREGRPACLNRQVDRSHCNIGRKIMPTEPLEVARGWQMSRMRDICGAPRLRQQAAGVHSGSG